jgi:hypothetical protein
MREKEDLGSLRFGLLLILIYSRYLMRRAEAKARAAGNRLATRDYLGL